MTGIKIIYHSEIIILYINPYFNEDDEYKNI